MPLKSAQNLWFSDDFKGKRVSLIHSNSLNIRSETWRRFHRKRFFDTYTSWVKFWIWSISRTVLTSFLGGFFGKKNANTLVIYHLVSADHFECYFVNFVNVIYEHKTLSMLNGALVCIVLTMLNFLLKSWGFWKQGLWHISWQSHHVNIWHVTWEWYLRKNVNH